MASYDYKAGKKRVKEILNNDLDVIGENRLPTDEKFTFDNSYKSWVSAIFVDIRDSSILFTDEDEKKVSKIIRSFTSEVVEILKGDDNLREIGIRGDCVYSVYTTPYLNDEHEIFEKCVMINTYMEMLNKLLKEKSFPEIFVGIGVSTAMEMVVKAGRKDAGINNKVWIGDAVSKASNLSSLGNKGIIGAMVFSSFSYDCFIDIEIKNSGEEAKKWFKREYKEEYGTYYHSSITFTEFIRWINEGMSN
ncbi:MAG: adenylate cyclase [Clostridiales bacterium]|nr:adenylate cyclase [Clostridiales bacterium]